ncbi:MAG TPA: site-2 protease family protein, partial [Nitrososphaerales archaeon]|nr:site-2 protease family protein [Nitrososphaerales archaeon]
MGSDEFKRVEFQYGVILVRTKRFQSLMDRLGATRISKPMGWVLLYLLPASAFFGFYLFLSEASILLSPRGADVAAYVRTIGPLANLGLPGINPYLPVVDGWIALIIAMVIHEGAHGIVARSLGLPVKASGLLFFLFVPIGAFVDVDETAIKQAKSSYSARVLAAGAGVNLIAGLACLLMLVLIVGSFVPAAAGAGIVGVASNGPAANGGLKVGDIVTQFDGK